LPKSGIDSFELFSLSNEPAQGTYAKFRATFEPNTGLKYEQQLTTGTGTSHNPHKQNCQTRRSATHTNATLQWE
jgi:hypothetical protein